MELERLAGLHRHRVPCANCRSAILCIHFDPVARDFVHWDWQIRTTGRSCRAGVCPFELHERVAACANQNQEDDREDPYEHEWRAPQLDATYGKSAQSAFEAIVSTYPDSPFAPRAQQELVKLDEWFAEKDYDTGYLYLKRKAYDSAIIYFKDVIRLHPHAKKTRDSYLRLLEAYRAIRYTEDARDLCNEMRKAYQGDREILEKCGPAPAPAPTT